MSSLKYTNKLENQRILVLGGTSGIGFGVAEAALEYGANVIISSSNQTKIDKAIARLTQHVQATGLPQRQLIGTTCDLANGTKLEDNIKSLLEFATQDGKLDHVVFTAGDMLRLNGLDVTVEQISEIAMVRSTAAIILAKHLSKYMKASVNSSFTVTGGTNGWRPGKGWSVVAGVCGGVEALARGLAVDLKPIRVNCANLGAIRTELFDSVFGDRVEELVKGMKSDTLTNTVGTPEEAAEIYLFFMKNTFVTGTVVAADGGRLVGDSRGD